MKHLLTLCWCCIAISAVLGTDNAENDAAKWHSHGDARTPQDGPVDFGTSLLGRIIPETVIESATARVSSAGYPLHRASTLISSLISNMRAGIKFWPLDILFTPTEPHDQVPYKVQKPPLDTDWTYKVGTNPWPEYPRPQLRRDRWQSLNGIWTWRAEASSGGVRNPPQPGPLEREVLVPACIESGLSGLQELSVSAMWYQTGFSVPLDWAGQQILLNFESVDYETTVFVNGVKMATHVGGYNRFTVDITHAIKFGDLNQLWVTSAQQF